jgi:hypothetical protein
MTSTLQYLNEEDSQQAAMAMAGLNVFVQKIA